jgi:hypothetical protein
MDTRIRFCFDAEGLHSTSFDVFNPPVLPQEGKIVRVDWKHYIEDEKALKVIKHIEMSSCFVAYISSINYKQDEVEMLVILQKDLDYENDVAVSSNRQYQNKIISTISTGLLSLIFSITACLLVESPVLSNSDVPIALSNSRTFQAFLMHSTS